jgi:hypothetical protein
MTDGNAMLDRLDLTHAAIRSRHQALSNSADRDRIGKYLQILYDISTCADGCRGGDHMFEYLSGRAFNLSYAAYDLLQIGLYDEALNQLRSLGELTNLASLCAFDNGAFNEWVGAGHDERLRRFGPGQVRKLIVAAKGILIVNTDLYAQLCELATHITPQTKPNTHNAAGRSHVGGSVQADGYAKGIELLQYLMYFMCTSFIAFVGRGDLVDGVPQPPSVEG